MNNSWGPPWEDIVGLALLFYGDADAGASLVT